jgi:hypothetical protein
MTNRFEDPEYRRALDDEVRARVQRKARNAVLFLADVVSGRVSIPAPEEEGDEDCDYEQLSRAFSAIENFVDWESEDREPLSAELLAQIFSGTPPPLRSDPPAPH